MKKGFFISCIIVVIGIVLWQTEWHTVALKKAKSFQGSYIVKIGRDRITVNDLHRDYLISTSGIERPISANSQSLIKKSVLKSLILRRLQLIEIKRNKFNLSDKERENAFQNLISNVKSKRVRSIQLAKIRDIEGLKEKVGDEATIEKYIQKVVFAPIQVDAKEVQLSFNKNSLGYVRPERVRVRQIVVDAEEYANEIYRDVKRNRRKPGYFSKKARMISVTPEAQKGGDLGFFARGDMPPIFNVAFSMRNRQIKGVIKSQYGYHIIQRTDHQNAKRLKFDEAKPKITETLIKEKKRIAYRKWLDLLLRKTPITYNNDYISLKSELL